MKEEPTTLSFFSIACLKILNNHSSTKKILEFPTQQNPGEDVQFNKILWLSVTENLIKKKFL